MSTKKLLLIIGGIAAALILLVILFVGAIAGVALYSIGHSAAADTARNFLRTNDKLRDQIGEVRDFGSIVTGNINVRNGNGIATGLCLVSKASKCNINVRNGNGIATLNLKAIGSRKASNVSVNLAYSNGGVWRVAEASSTSSSGAELNLIDSKEPRVPVDQQ